MARKKYDAFISFKAEEMNDAVWVRTALESHGISCWMAPDSIPGGSSYVNEIADAINNSKVFVLLLSENSQQSQWVSKELDMALNKGKTILPYIIEKCELNDSFGFYLAGIHMYEAYLNKKEMLEKMISEIKVLTADKIKKTEKTGVMNFFKKMSPLSAVATDGSALPGKIVTVISLCLFLFIFAGLISATDNILFAFIFSASLLAVMWMLARKPVRTISRIKNKFVQIVSALVTGIILNYATLAIGAFVASKLRNFY